MPAKDVSPVIQTTKRRIHPMFVVIAAVVIILIIVGLFVWLDIERDDDQGN